MNEFGITKCTLGNGVSKGSFLLLDYLKAALYQSQLVADHQMILFWAGHSNL